MFQVFAEVKALIENEGKYLSVIQKVGGDLIYDLPGGGVNYGEPPLESLKRQVKEEVNLEAEIVKPLGVWWYFRKSDDNQVVATTFLCKKTGGEVNITHNPSGMERIKKAEWLSKEEMLKNFPDESLKDIIKDL